MKLRSVRLDQVGRHNGWVLEDLADGLTVVFGPNEAGKSTLLAAVRGVLFGRFAAAESNLPLAANATGGLVVEDSLGERLTVERILAGKRMKEPTATEMNGFTVTGDTALKSRFPELAEVEDGLYRSVFTFQLAELRAFSQSDGRAVAKVASMESFGERSTMEVEQMLENLAKSIFNPNRRATIPPLSKALREIQGIENELRRRQDTPEGLELLRQEQATAEAAEQTAKLQLDELQAKRQQLVRYQALLPAHLRLLQLETIVTDATAYADETLRFEAVQGRLSSLHARASAIEERVQRLAELSSQLQDDVAQLRETLYQLADRWTGPCRWHGVTEEATANARSWVEAFQAWEMTCPLLPEQGGQSLVTGARRLLELPLARIERADLDDWVERWQVTLDLLHKAQQSSRDAELELQLHETASATKSADTFSESDWLRAVADLRDEEDALERDAQGLRQWQGHFAEFHQLNLTIGTLERASEAGESAERTSKLTPSRWVGSWLVVLALVALAVIGLIFWPMNKGVHWASVASVVLGFAVLIVAGLRSRVGRPAVDGSAVQTAIRLNELRAARLARVDQIHGCRTSLERTAISTPIDKKWYLEREALAAAEQSWRSAKSNFRSRQDWVASQQERIHTRRLLTSTLARRNAELDARLREQEDVLAQWSAWLEPYGGNGTTSPLGFRTQWMKATSARHLAEKMYEQILAWKTANAVAVGWLHQIHVALAATGDARVEQSIETNRVVNFESDCTATLEAASSHTPAITSIADVHAAARTLVDVMDLVQSLLNERMGWQRSVRDTRIEISAICGDIPTYERLRLTLAGLTAEQLVVEREAVEQQLQVVEQTQQEASRQHGDAASRIRELKQSTETADLLWKRADLLAERDAHATEWAALKVGAAALRVARERMERNRRPDALIRAGALFTTITGGRYRDLFARAEHGQSLHLAVLDAAGRRWDIDTLSRGTREQIYLALRIALIEEYGTHGVDLPVILDDPLVNFDGQRFRSAFHLLRETAVGRQFIYLTCHSEILEIARQTADVNVVLL